MSDADCTPGREPRNVAASYVVFIRRILLIPVDVPLEFKQCFIEN